MNAKTIRRCHRHFAHVLAALMMCGPTQAAIHCVSTGTQLANALTSAASNGQDDEIRIVATTLTGTSNSGATRAGTTTWPKATWTWH